MIDPVIAKRVLDLRWPEDASLMARNTIRDEAFVKSQLDLRDTGITHDDLIVALYDALEAKH